jgi:acetyl-CoA carboxylase carboxyl transferase subunit beta
MYTGRETHNMSILPWIEDQKRLKLLNAINAPKYVDSTSDSSKGLWTRCDKCGVILYIKHLKENQRVCFGCSYHLQMSSYERIENILDKNTWRAFDESVSPCDPLEFQDEKEYTDRLEISQERTGLQDAIQTGSGMVDGIPVALGVMDFAFMGGSMGSVVGEKVTRLIEYATQEGLTLILICASGGARMQEGVFSLMQMAKISSALQVYQTCANLLYISIITSPTTGGVTASFGMLGDIILAEPRALIGFAGRRVIEQTLCEDLPDDFQTSEYMLHHGLVDLIVPRRFLRQALSETIRLYKNAPFKQHGKIPFGVQNPISFITEEKLRRRWGKVNTFPIQPKSNTELIELLKETEPEQSSGNRNRVPEQISGEPHSGGEAELPSLERAQNILKNEYMPEAEPEQSSGNRNYVPESLEYRDILTSFQTMFHLFSKQIVTRYQFDTDRTQPNRNVLGTLGNGTTTADPNSQVRALGAIRSRASLESVNNPSRSSIGDVGTFGNINRSTTNSKIAEIEAHLTNLDQVKPEQSSGNQNYVPEKAYPSNLEKEPTRGWDQYIDKGAKQPPLLTRFRNLSEKADMNDQDTNLGDTNTKMRTVSNTSPVEESKIDQRELIEYLNDINFLNQAIELAAVESIEWRAFYVHQKVSNRTSFLEDFVGSDSKERDENGENITLYSNTLQNTLFYRSICNPSMQVDEEVI